MLWKKIKLKAIANKVGIDKDNEKKEKERKWNLRQGEITDIASRNSGKQLNSKNKQLISDEKEKLKARFEQNKMEREECKRILHRGEKESALRDLTPPPQKKRRKEKRKTF